MKLSPELEIMIDDFCAAIKQKVLSKQNEGYRGYWAPHMQGPIEQKLERNFRQKDWIDVGALAAMRWSFTNKAHPADERTHG